jgi:hypothetical protein
VAGIIKGPGINRSAAAVARITADTKTGVAAGPIGRIYQFGLAKSQKGPIKLT